MNLRMHRVASSAARVRGPRLCAGALLLVFLVGRACAGEPMTVHADLRDAARGLIDATLGLPVAEGPLTLLYAKWIAGEHGPTGPVTNLSGIQITAAGRPLAWRRDLENMYALHVEVPPGVSRIEVHTEYLGPASGNFGAGPTTTPMLAVLNWNVAVLYPSGVAAADLVVVPSVTVPAGWGVGSSLAVDSVDGATTRYKPVSLEMLIDQPVITGAYFKRFDLTPGLTPGHFIEAAADSPEALDVSKARVKALDRIPGEYAALMGIRHYETYHFLVSLSNRFDYNGVEHHQTSDDRGAERALVDDDQFPYFASLLTHEYFHSWNGKFRRPAGLLSPDYQKPMQTDLLWVYEGLTQYYGNVLAARAGLFSPEQYRENLAATAARMTAVKGRTWRPLRDTVDAAQLLYLAPNSWGSRRRGIDFYDEGELIWLEADALIRARTHGERSLDDFCRAFLGDGGGGPISPDKVPSERPRVVPYDAADVTAALGRILPYDWTAFFAERLTTLRDRPPLEGIALAGSAVTYTERTNATVESSEKAYHSLDLTSSLGLSLDDDKAEVTDVVPGSPADVAGLTPGMDLLAVNGRRYSDERLKGAVAGGKSGAPIELLVDSGSFVSSHRLAYGGGLVFPHLERAPGTPDLIAAIIAPRVK
jgi:predicted metalloprotease with PDZ domain